MPMMSKNGKIVCVVCPVIKKKAKRIAEKKRSLKPTKPNQQHYGGIPRQSKQYLTSDDQPEDVRDEISVAETKMELPYGKQNQSLLGGIRMKGSEMMTMFDEANNLRDMEEGMFNNCLGGENVVRTVGSATTVSTNHDPRDEKEIYPRSSWPYMKDKSAVYNSNISHQPFPSSVGHEPAASIHSDYWVRHSSSQSKTDIGPQSKSIQCYSDLDHRSTHQLHVGVEHAHSSHQHDASQQHPYHEHIGSAYGGSMVSGIENHQNEQTVIQQHPSYDHLNVRVEMSQSHHSQSVYGSPIILDTQSHSNQQTTIQQHSSYEHPGITVERSHSHNSQSAYSGSVVSDTQCPRNIPSGEMIWHYKASGVTNQLESTFSIQSGNSYHGHHVHAIDAMDGQKETCYNYSQNNDFLPELVGDTMNAKYDCFSHPMGVDRQGNESSLGPVPSEMHQHDHKSHPRQATSRPIEFHKNEIQSHKADLSCQMKNDVIQEKSLHQQHLFPLKGSANSLSINTSRSYENEEICKVEMEGKDNRKEAKGPNYKDEQASRVDVVDGLPDTQGGDNVKLSDTALYDELNANASKKGIPSPSSIVNNRDYLDLQGHSRTPRQQISDNPENSTCNSDELESRGKNGFSVPIARPGGLQELDCHKCSVLPIHTKDVSSQSVTGCDIKQGRDVNGLVGQANRPSQGSVNVQYEGPSGKNEAITNTNQRITSQSHRVETKDAHTQAQVERKDAKIQANMSHSPALLEPLKVDHDDFKLPRISHMQGNDDFRCDQNPLSDELNEISIKRQSPSQLNIKRDGENYYLDSHPQSSASEAKDNVKDRIYGAPNDRLGQNSYDLLCSDQAQTRAAQENECHDLVPITPKHKNSCHMRTVNTNLSLSNATPLSSGKSHCDTVCKERKDSMQQDHRNIHSLELPQQKYVQPSKHFQDTALYPPPSSPLVRDYADIRLPDNHQRSSEGEKCIDNILPIDLEKHRVSKSTQPRGSFNQEGRPTSNKLGNQASCFIQEISRNNFDVSLLQQFGQYDSRKIEIPAAMCVEDKQVHLVTDGHTLDEDNSIQMKMLRLKSKLTSLKNQMTPKSMHTSEILKGRGNNVEELPADVMPFNTSSQGKMDQLELESHPYNSWKRSQPNNETGHYGNGNTEYHHAHERQHNRKFHFQREHCDKILPSSPTLIVLNDRCDSPSYLSEMEHAERYRPDPTPSHLNYRHCSDFVDHDIHGKRHAESTRRHGHDPPGEKMIMRHRREKDDHRHRPKGDLGNNHPRRKPKNKHHRPDPRAYLDDKLSHFNQTKYPSESIKNDLSKQTPKSKQKNVTSRGGKRQNKSSHDEKSSSKREQSHGTIHHLVETTTESSFDQRNNVHLSIPSWVDDEIDAPLQHAKSEDSMDQILRRIDGELARVPYWYW